jgi:hypothetical protein
VILQAPCFWGGVGGVKYCWNRCSSNFSFRHKFIIVLPRSVLAEYNTFPKMCIFKSLTPYTEDGGMKIEMRTFYHHHHLSAMELGHLLTRSGLTCPEVSSKVCHDSFCQLGNSVSSPWATYVLMIIKSKAMKSLCWLF